MADNTEVKASKCSWQLGLTLGTIEACAEGSSAAVSSTRGLRHRLKCHTICQWSLN